MFDPGDVILPDIFPIILPRKLFARTLANAKIVTTSLETVTSLAIAISPLLLSQPINACAGNVS